MRTNAYMIKTFDELGKRDAGTAGGKSASLGELTRAGIPVPGGFVILASTFETFLQTNDLRRAIATLLGEVDHTSVQAIQEVSERIRKLVMDGDIPVELTEGILRHFRELQTEFVAVRSSATAEDGAEHAWAGQLESFLNTNETSLLDNVKRCFASLFTPRAIFYRFEKGLDKTEISVAVVVQKMVQSEVSGVAFSVHPISNNNDEIVIEAGYGLGEAIVSGQITPDLYVVSKGRNEVLEKSISKQARAIVRKRDVNDWEGIPTNKHSLQKLSDTHIHVLADLVRKIESHYGFPSDIEWALEDDKLFITQSRPITTLNNVSITVPEFVPKHDDYIKFTQAKGVTPLFFAFGFLMHIKDLHGLVFYQGDKQVFKTFILKEKSRVTLTEGQRIYAQDVFVLGLEETFTKVAGNVSRAYDALMANAHPGSFGDYLDALGEFSDLYRRTEFFYTDEAKLTRDDHIEKTFEKAKLTGRSFINAFIYDEDSLQRKVIRMFAEKFGVSYEDMLWYSAPEIFGGFEGARVDPDEIARRKVCYMISSDGGERPHVVSGGQAYTMLTYFTNDNQSGLMQGHVAYPGEVTGNAFVLHVGFGNLKELVEMAKQMNEGDILVADSTIPEIISLCNKASAILTNQGGVMSHAAIVARELKKPCIVGIGDVTEKVKTGQRIRVDANLGYITLL